MPGSPPASVARVAEPPWMSRWWFRYRKPPDPDELLRGEGLSPGGDFCHSEIRLGNAMRRKPQSKPEPVVPAELLEQAKLAIAVDRLKKGAKCSVCGAETSGPSDE